MALAKEEGGQAYGDLEACYRNALRCAEQAQLPRLQLRAMKLLHSVQQKMDCPEVNVTLGQLEELSETVGSESGDESETEELENSEAVEDSELELSESDDDEVEGYEKSLPGRRKMNRWNRRNEKGETVLHRACIEGNLKHVQCLVEKGHPLSPRDYCGWTPLHEACNHGHLEIVRLLLDQRVNVNDPGGPHCEGITPLHDALTCGNFDVAELLIQNGASATVRNAKGQTPLDSLYQWRQNYYKHLDQDTKHQCKHMERLLKSSSNRGVQPVQDLRESDLFDSESSQSLAPLELCVPPSSSHPVDVENRKDPGDSGGLCRIRQTSGTAPLPQGRVNRVPSQSGADLSGTSPVCSTQVRTRNRLDCPPLGEEVSSEEDVTVDSFQPVTKRHRVLGQRSPAHTGDLAALVTDGSWSQEEASEWHPPRTEQDRDLDIPSVGTSAYRRAIRNLGSAKSRILSQALAETSQNTEVPTGKSALIPASEYVEDSWLEDDLGSNRTKKRAREHSWLDSVTGPEDNGHSSEDELCPGSELPESGQRLSLQKKRSRQMRMTQIVDRAIVGRTRTNMGKAKIIASTSVPHTSGARTSELIHTANQPTAPANSAISAEQFTLSVNSVMPPSIRVRVRVQDNIFLIPIPHRDSELRTVSWLAEQAAQRYYQTCGLRPKLSLKKEGALLAPQDPIVHVLQSNEEVLAEVLSWDLPPLTDRYKRACDSLALAVNGLVLRACETQENSTCFRLSNLSLNKEQLTPILRALKLQTSTRQLCLAANRLGDDAMEELLASLVTMPKLTLLDLSSNQITYEGLKKLSEARAASTEPPFPGLEELNLSLNPLGNGSSQLIASLIRSCPLLSTLKLQACGLSARFLQQHRLLLTDAMKSAVHLKTLCLSHNALGSVGAELILQSLPHRTVTHLDIAAIVGNHGDTPTMEHLARYLSQDDCSLTHLNLSGNRLTDDSVRDLSRCLLLCPSLVSLDVSANPGISTVGVEMLLGAVRERSSGMQYLNVSGSSVQGPANSAAIGAKLRELSLCSNRLNKYDKESLLSGWKETGRELHTVSSLCKCLIRAVPSSHR
ncbi:tonsoku-like protein isoform X2 [Mustelus asterias]